MRAVFIHDQAILRDSHIDAESPSSTWHLMPATLEAVRMLGSSEALVFIYGSQDSGADRANEESGEADHGRALSVLVQQIEAGGGRVDGLILCPHHGDSACRCWGEFPSLLWLPALQFDLPLDQCYVVGDRERDVITARAAGAWPVIVLGGRSIGEVFGNRPECKGSPIAPDLTTAVDYIGVEEDITRQLGHARQPALVLPAEEKLLEARDALPRLIITSDKAESLRTRVLNTRAKLRDTLRWLTFLALGALGVSLGIAYLLTHLYRVAPFPRFVYYLTLQFIPRALRGALFIAFGIGVVILAVRSFLRSTNVWLRPPLG